MMRHVGPLILFVIAPLLAGCSGPFSALDPAGPAAMHIANLWWAMLTGAALLFILVMGLLFFAMRGRMRPKRPLAWIVYGGLAMPVSVLAVLVGYSLWIGEKLLPHALASAPVAIEVVASQWQWRFRYPGLDGAETDVLVIPAGEPVDLSITSTDVIHSFWVPRLAGKMDAIPGRHNALRIQADRPGIYRGQCAEFCGTEHTGMRFTVEAVAPEALAARITEQAL